MSLVVSVLETRASCALRWVLEVVMCEKVCLTVVSDVLHECGCDEWTLAVPRCMDRVSDLFSTMACWWYDEPMWISSVKLVRVYAMYISRTAKLCCSIQ